MVNGGCPFILKLSEELSASDLRTRPVDASITFSAVTWGVTETLEIVATVEIEASPELSKAFAVIECVPAVVFSRNIPTVKLFVDTDGIISFSKVDPSKNCTFAID